MNEITVTLRYQPRERLWEYEVTLKDHISVEFGRWTNGSRAGVINDIQSKLRKMTKGWENGTR